MAIICPTITAFDEHEYRAQVETTEKFAQRIHIDLMDGQFAPTISPTPDKIWLPNNLICDIHIMFKDVVRWADDLIRLRPHLVVVHAEVHEHNDLPLFATKMREAGIKTGLALLQDTTVESVKYVLPHMQHVLIFSGNLGYHGGSTADLALLDKVKQIKQENRWAEIGWDGGVNDQNALQLIEGGVDVLNVGGFIQKSENPDASYQNLQSLLQS